jgi:DNA-binding NarL/FixJ family response regulator
VSPSPGLSGAPEAVSVLVVDPHTKLRTALVAALGAAPGITVTAATGTFDEALAIVRLRRPDVALVDLAALGHRGVAGLAELRAARSQTALLVIGVVEDPALEHAALRHGAVGRILKDTPERDLARLVRDAAGRRSRLRLVPSDR